MKHDVLTGDVYFNIDNALELFKVSQNVNIEIMAIKENLFSAYSFYFYVYISFLEKA